MAKVPKRNGSTKQEPKLGNLGFDVPMLDSFIRFARCEYVGANQLSQLQTLIQQIDLQTYQYDIDLLDRLVILRTLLEAIISHNIHNQDILLSYLAENCGDSKLTLRKVNLQENQLASSECDYIARGIRDRLDCLEVFRQKAEIIDLLNHIDGTSFEVSYYELVKTLKEKMSRLLVSLDRGRDNQGLIREFCFSDADAAALIDRIVQKKKKPTSVLQCGIRQLNALLAPGFEGTRLYMFLGATGKGKSSTLLNMADQIRRFNPQIIPVENGMRKCVLFISLENSVEETVERLYDMYSDVNDDMRDKDTSEVLEVLRNAGQLTFTSTSGIDLVFRKFGNLQITTADIRTLCRELNDKGMEPICIVLDFIKKLESVHPNNGDERTRISYATKELKTLAEDMEIPIISAMQLNREGNAIIDAAMRENKQDVARFVGASNIANAWDIMEDSDWVGLINPEIQRSTNQLFLTFKRLKCRVKTDRNMVDYFNHPFVNEKAIRLAPDVQLDHSLSIYSLASDLESIDETEYDKRMRPRVSSKEKEERLAAMNRIHAIQLKDLAV